MMVPIFSFVLIFGIMVFVSVKERAVFTARPFNLVAELLLQSRVGMWVLVCRDQGEAIQGGDDDCAMIAAHELGIGPSGNILMAHDIGSRPAAIHAGSEKKGVLHLIFAEVPFRSPLREVRRLAVVVEAIELASGCVVYHA